MRLIEADQVSTPFGVLVPEEKAVDGIIFDGFGNPVAYYVLRSHPGDRRAWRAGINDYDLMPAETVVHLFRAERRGRAVAFPRSHPRCRCSPCCGATRWPCWARPSRRRCPPA
ncbi:MAG: phage portal protein [Planctomycetes bacterium]|nr:phage portal protein [Planctomycetota bacterium]